MMKLKKNQLKKSKKKSSLHGSTHQTCNLCHVNKIIQYKTN
jgi:hypothetical protein